jgi:hypothetical protein
MTAADHDIALTQGVMAAAIGRRAAPRLRLALPARVTSITATQNCILLDISRGGARIALASPVPCWQSSYIAFGRFELFGMVVRSESSAEAGGGGVNGVAFDEPISQAEVLEIRRFAEVFEQCERQALHDQVRRWVTGER